MHCVLGCRVRMMVAEAPPALSSVDTRLIQLLVSCDFCARGRRDTLGIELEESPSVSPLPTQLIGLGPTG